MQRIRDLMTASCVLAGACTQATHAPPERVVEATTPGPAPLPTARTMPPVGPRDAARTHVLALRHAPEAARMQVLPLRLGSVGFEVGAEVERPALPRADWPGHFTAVVGHAGGAVWASAEPDGAGWQVVTHTLGVAQTRAVAVPLRPAALHMVGSEVVVGADNTIGRIGLLAPTLAWQEIHRRPDMKFKAYDLMVRSGDWLIAIDDEVMPMYADSFAVDMEGRATHGAGWSMPGVINGHYTHAALVRSGARDGVLFTVSPYGVMDGSGQDLAALAIRGDALMTGERTILNSTRSTDPPVLEEHVSRRTNKPERLAAGTDYTPWRGLAVDAERVLIAAGARGLLVLPHGFTPDTKATVVAVGDECRDVLVADGHTWVLVGGGEDAVVELKWEGGEVEELRRTRLAGGYERLVR